MDDIEDRVAIARLLLSSGIEPFDLEAHPAPESVPETALVGKRVLGIPFPDGLAQVPTPLDPWS